LAALLYFADPLNKSLNVPVEKVPLLVPRTILQKCLISPEQWANRIQTKVDAVATDMTTRQARQQFLQISEKWPLFGASFYFVRRVITKGRELGECVIAVNKQGVRVLANKSHQVLLHYTFAEIESANPYTLSDSFFLEVRLVQKPLSEKPAEVMTIETELGAEIARLLGQYLYLKKDANEPVYIVQNRHKA
jgi:PAS domain-containing protein